ncbi:MAG: hypothetical protein U1D30_08920 [Planctomycetota bacterium]
MPNRRLLILIWLIVLASLCMFRGEPLTSPPYEDHALGIWNEANFLATHNFDYLRLRYSEKNILEGGGVRSYMISVLPTLLALLIVVSPAPIIPIIVFHIVVYASASLIFTLMFAILYERTGGVVAMLASLATLTTPLYLVQTQMIGMEIIMTAAGFVGFVLLTRGRPVTAALFFLFAFFVKASGQIFTLAAIVFYFLQLLGMRPSGALFTRAKGRLGLIANSLALLLEIAAGLWADDPAIRLSDLNWPSMLRFPQVMLWAPDVAAIFSLSLLLAPIAFLAWQVRHLAPRFKRANPLAIRRAILGQLVEEQAPVVFAFIFLSGLTLALNLYVVFPRYVVPGIPFVYILLSLAATLLSVPRAPLAALLALIVSVNLINHDGKWYPSANAIARDEFAYWTWWHPRMGVLTERSEEYIQDHDSIVRMMGFLENNYLSHPIITEQLLFDFYLLNPVCGYVLTPFPHVLPLNNFEKAINDFKQTMTPIIAGQSDNFPVYIWSGKSRTLIPPPGPYTEILFQDNHPTLPYVLYRFKPEALPKDLAALEEWYLDHTWGPQWQAMRVMEQQSYLKATGRSDRLYHYILEAQESLPATDRLGFRQMLDDLLRTNPHARAAEPKIEAPTSGE